MLSSTNSENYRFQYVFFLEMLPFEVESPKTQSFLVFYPNVLYIQGQKRKKINFQNTFSSGRKSLGYWYFRMFQPKYRLMNGGISSDLRRTVCVLKVLEWYHKIQLWTLIAPDGNIVCKMWEQIWNLRINIHPIQYLSASSVFVFKMVKFEKIKFQKVGDLC